MVKKFLIVSLLVMLIAHSNCQFSNGMSSSGCPSTCKIANHCQCPSLTNPAGYALSDLPQFVTFTWDDAVETDVSANWFPSNNFWNGSILDTLGCRPRPTFYVTTTNTNYGYVNVFSKLGLVCEHSVNHYTNRSSSLENFTYETNQSRDWIQGYSKMAYPVKCSRAPFLETSDNYFQSLVNAGITLDSSVMATAQGNGTRFWPFTLDYGIQENDVCSDLQCPSKGFAGLWQIPLQHMYTRSNGVITNIWTDLMDPNVTSSNYDATLARFKYNFAENYAMSRAPLGLYIHYFWFQINSNLWSFVTSNLDTTKVQFVNDYYNYIKTFPQVIFTTDSMIIQWIKNPQTYSQIVADKANNANSIWKCPDYTVNINNSCPQNYPLTTCTNTTDGSTFLSCGCTEVNYTTSCTTVSNCQTQNQATCQCTTCNAGYQVSNGSCSSCSISQCSSYSSGCTCQTCNAGYQLSDNTCSSCSISQCTTYSSGCTCSACNTGYKVISGTCQTCAVSQCTAYSSGCMCSSCNSGYQLSTGLCTACLVAQCSTYSSGCICSACNAGYQIISGTCQICGSISQCSSYSLSSSCSCEACNSGFTLSSNKCCQTITACSTYSSTCGCSGCQNSYTLSSGACCATITSCSGYNSTCGCSSCASGTSLSNGKCISTVNNCNSYNADSSCSTCNSPYTLVGNTCTCPSVQNCNSFITGTCTCYDCSAGYILSTQTNTCNACGISGCSQYSAGCSCNGCSTGFTLTNSKCCNTILNCGTYDSTSCACTSCASGFTLNAGVCQQNVGCSNSLCTNFYANCSCSSCISGYNLLSNFTCVAASNTANIVGCYAYLYSATTKCYACYPGYTLTNAKTSCGTWKNIYPFSHSYDGFCGANSNDSNDPWLYANCQQCYQTIQTNNCTTLHNSTSYMVYDEMNCGNYNTVCVRKGYCKPISTNWILSCSTCQSCYEGDKTCPTGFTCSRNSGCMDATQSCSTHL